MTPEEPPVNLAPVSGPPEPPPAPEPAAPPLPERDPFWGYSDLLWFAGMAIGAMLVGWAVGGLTLALFKLKVASLAAEMIVLYAVLFGSLQVMFRVRYDRPFWRSLGWKPIRLPVMMVMLSGMITAVLVAMASTLIRTPTGENPMTQLLETRADVLVMGTLGITLAPICEELAFRGFLQPLLVRSLGAVPGIALAAVAFGLLHFQEYGNSWRHALIIALAGAAFGCMRHATGSTKAAAIMHAAYNLLFFIALMTEKRILPQIW
ncbi:MAG: type II CAAX endopeptidase family protein [Bryobacteraceae bacterium]|jgi:membrane protease YdiL (CAAX protease family)